MRQRIAVISDIHSNLEALEAVLAEIDRLGCQEIICLGDLVGYGPDPEASVDLVMERCGVVLRGNHDDALFRPVLDFNPIARNAINYTRKIMKPGLVRAGRKAKRWEFLRHLPLQQLRGDWLLVHASPNDPLKEYLLKTDLLFCRDKIAEALERTPRLAFVGHTHFPGVFDEKLRFHEPRDLRDGQYRFGDGKAIINVGSVGQPRDKDPRACFVTVEADGARFHRVEYDFTAVQQKILASGPFDEFSAARLARGE
ncbi:MAG: metallophosphoesterase family protein [Planctomycetes bacterium]|nr:metallophosphoesterase family protein [Planctomycetota bacterium]